MGSTLHFTVIKTMKNNIYIRLANLFWFIVFIFCSFGGAFVIFYPISFYISYLIRVEIFLLVYITLMLIIGLSGTQYHLSDQSTFIYKAINFLALKPIRWFFVSLGGLVLCKIIFDL